MTSDTLLHLFKQPETVNESHLQDLKELIKKYPYFYQARLLYLKALQKTESIDLESEIELSSIYTSDRKWLFYYLYPEKKIAEPQINKTIRGNMSGDYFEMIESLEKNSTDSKQSLKELAAKLKKAREYTLVKTDAKKIIQDKKTEEALENESDKESLVSNLSEDTVKKMISQKKYKEAIEILKILNLNNPKKNVYFADQIRFLEKILENKK